MKILLFSDFSNLRFKSLVSTLDNLDYEVGLSTGDLSIEELISFAPSVILTDMDDHSVLKDYCDIVIAVNETGLENSFSLTNQEAQNYVKPFIDLSQKSEFDPKYECDVSFIGDPSVFGGANTYLINNMDFKFFNHEPIQTIGYCGVCHPENYGKLYKSSKVSLVPPNSNEYRMFEIIYCDGYPVVYHDEDQFLEEIYTVVKDGIKSTLPITKEDLTSYHTNYDRMAEICIECGLEKTSRELLDMKFKKAIS